MHSYLASRVSEIEAGLSLAEDGVEYPTEAGRIDLLAKDADNQIVVIELKAGRPTTGRLVNYWATRVVYQPGRHKFAES